MMRVNRYRGKKVRDGKWVYGDLLRRRVWGNDIVVIRCFDSGLDNYEEYQVDPKTVGQFTGIRDSYRDYECTKGHEVYEGDIVKNLGCFGGRYAVKYFGDQGYPAFDLFPGMSNMTCNGLSYLAAMNDFQVIGNIHDNPELELHGDE
jgi:uncharacterized phage protein (TIGR01671 family)